MSGTNTAFNVPVGNAGTVDVQAGMLLHNVIHTQTGGFTQINGGSIAGTAALNINGGVLRTAVTN